MYGKCVSLVLSQDNLEFRLRRAIISAADGASSTAKLPGIEIFRNLGLGKNRTAIKNLLQSQEGCFFLKLVSSKSCSLSE